MCSVTLQTFSQMTWFCRAETVLSELQALNATATHLSNSVSAEKRPAFFELVLHPVQATATLATMWIYAGINNWRASQARVSANNYAAEVESLFEADYDLELEYHSLLNGELVSSPFTRSLDICGLQGSGTI